MRVVVLHPCTKFEVRRPCRSEDMAHDVCASINGPGDLDLWPFDLETGVRVTSKVLDLRSEFVHAIGLRVLQLFAMYATDGWTDKTNAYCPFHTGGGIIIFPVWATDSWQMFRWWTTWRRVWVVQAPHTRHPRRFRRRRLGHSEVCRVSSADSL